MTLRRCSFAVAMACWLSSAGLADQFVLKDGRTIRGVVKSEKPIKDTNDKQFVIELSPGVMILLNSREIKQQARSTKPEQEYAELMQGAKDTIEFHLTVASWCHQNGLNHHEVAHYERVVDLDPENATARAGLKYTKGKDGRWVKRDVLMTEGRGKVRVGNKYRFPELVALEDAQAKASDERIGLIRDITKWQKDVLENNKRAAESLAKLQALDGPQASAALAELFFPRPNATVRKATPPDEMRKLYVAVLTRLADPVAVQTLIRISLADSSQDVRDPALEALRTLAPRAATLAFIQALNSDKPTEINAAGRALAAMQDESAILPLIEHIITTHRITTPGSNATNASFNNQNQGGFTFGNEAPKTFDQPVQNPDVLSALSGITGQNLGYKKDAWLSWYQQNYLPSVGDLRRDP